ncbi:uncharacterized protein LOC111025162 [Momordica charantia]|uniref:Uncharacterized protein LOC111025162 n=1 Tax=Momordica charantia TaxID=3673 RepID=A0A6J1DXW1_MOMCH|nr:uncharacterized protein LOC111025162 [Momordica charantia]
MSDGEDTDSDAPEEFTAEQGIQQDQEITKVQNESKARVVREGKERRRLWAEKKTPRPSKKGETVEDVAEIPSHIDQSSKLGMLPSNLVQLLADREKQVFSSDPGDEKPAAKPKTKRKKTKSSGIETVVLNKRQPAQCLQNSMEFLKKRKMNIPRSSSVLDNPNQALRRLSSSGLLTKN